MLEVPVHQCCEFCDMIAHAVPGGRQLKPPSILARLALVLTLLQPGLESVCTAASIVALGMVGFSPSVSAQATSSGGYSRPGGSSLGGGARRPSTGGGGGGYSRPFSAGTAGTSGFAGGDRSVSRSYSGQALQNYQQRQQAPAGTPAGSPWERRPSVFGGDNGSYVPAVRRPPTQNAYVSNRGFGNAVPYSGGQSRFGAWDTVFLLSLLNSLGAPGHTQFFRDNRDNPDYQAWRRGSRPDGAAGSRARREARGT
ncbi:MAG TPA: hypothetical protein VGI78_06540 [Acetobacteraceae bacterium]